jgi:hypothetical protein
VFEIHFSSGIDDVGSWRNFLHERKDIEKKGGYMYMYDVPAEDVSDPKTGEITPPVEKVVKELKFREAGWHELLEERPKLREFVLNRIEQLMTVVYNKDRPHQIEGDAEPEEFESDD